MFMRMADHMLQLLQPVYAFAFGIEFYMPLCAYMYADARIYILGACEDEEYKPCRRI